MDAQENLFLRWDGFNDHTSSAFQTAREQNDFLDVSLVCAGGQVQAHKVVLSVCSPFFRRVFKDNPHPHPLIYMKGVPHSHLQAVLDFVYTGHAVIAQDQLDAFLAVADELQIKGLHEDQPVNQGAAPIKSEPIVQSPAVTSQDSTLISVTPASNVPIVSSVTPASVTPASNVPIVSSVTPASVSQASNVSIVSSVTPASVTPASNVPIVSSVTPASVSHQNNVISTPIQCQEAPSPRVQHPPSRNFSVRNLTFPQTTQQDNENTYRGKVDLRDSEHDKEKNIDSKPKLKILGSVYISKIIQGMYEQSLSEDKQKQNDDVVSTGKKGKAELIDNTIDDGVVSTGKKTKKGRTN